MATKIAIALSAAALCTYSASAHEQTGSAATKGESTQSSSELSGSQLAELFDEAMANEEFAAAINPLIAEMLVTGEPEAGWSTKGVYLPEWMAQNAEASGTHVLYEDDGESVSFQYLGNTTPTLPKGYRSFILRENTSGAQTDGALAGFAPGIWLSGSAPFARKGNALCSKINGLGMTLHTNRSLEDWNELEFAAALLFYSILGALDKSDICTVYFEQEDGTLTSFAYTRSGEPYINLNAEPERMELIPASKVTGIISKSKISNPFAD